MLTFKFHEDAKDYFKADPLLQRIIRRIDELMHEYNVHATVTSLIRKEGVHATGRAADLRTWELLVSVVQNIIRIINKEFPRSDDKPTALYHDTGKGYHIHAQVEPIERRGIP